MKKPTFVFDLGNVIVYYKPDEYLKRFGLEGERAAEFKRATFNDPVWLTATRVWSRARKKSKSCAQSTPSWKPTSAA